MILMVPSCLNSPDWGIYQGVSDHQWHFPPSSFSCVCTLWSYHQSPIKYHWQLISGTLNTSRRIQGCMCSTLGFQTYSIPLLSHWSLKSALGLFKCWWKTANRWMFSFLYHFPTWVKHPTGQINFTHQVCRGQWYAMKFTHTGPVCEVYHPLVVTVQTADGLKTWHQPCHSQGTGN